MFRSDITRGPQVLAGLGVRIPDTGRWTQYECVRVQVVPMMKSGEEVPWVVGPLHYQSGQIGPGLLRSALRSSRRSLSRHIPHSLSSIVIGTTYCNRSSHAVPVHRLYFSCRVAFLRTSILPYDKQLLTYRFYPQVTKREGDSSLMQLKEEFRTYESLRREHDAQIVQIALEAGLRIAPDQWSSLLYGDVAHKSHMQSIMDKLQVGGGTGGRWWMGKGVARVWVTSLPGGDGWGGRRRWYERVAFRVRKGPGFPFFSLEFFPVKF